MNGEDDQSFTNGSDAAGAAVDGPRSLQPPENSIQHQSSSSSDDEALVTPKETDGSDDTIKDLHHEIHTLRLERSDLLLRVEEITGQMERSDAGARSIAARAAALEGEIDRTQEDLILTSSEAEEARSVAESLRRSTMDLEARMTDLAMEKEKAAANALKKEGEVWSLKEGLEFEKVKARDTAAEKEEELRVAREKARLEVEGKEGVIVSLKEELTKGDGMKVSWVTAAAVAASTGVVAAAITAFCLRHSRER